MSWLQYESFIRQYSDYEHAEDIKRANFILSEAGKRKKVLDVGCGNGNNSILLALQGNQVLGIDVDMDSVVSARQKAKKMPRIYEANFMLIHANEDSPIFHQSYDVILCSEVLEHLHDPEELLIKLYAALAPGGKLIVTVPNGHGPRETFVTKPVQYGHKLGLSSVIHSVKKLFGYSGKTVQSENPGLGHIQFFSKASLQSIISKFGFSLEKFQNADSVERVFPFSMLYNRAYSLQKIDCKMADIVPSQFTSGFYTSWKK